MSEDFINGLSFEEKQELRDIRTALETLSASINRLPGHRNLAVARTKVEEAIMWLEDRERRTPKGDWF